MTARAADLFRAVWPRFTAKEAARCAGMSVRTAEGWMQGAEPAASVLMRMAARNDQLRAELLRRLGEPNAPIPEPVQRSFLAPAGSPRPADRDRAGAGRTPSATQGRLRLGW